MPTYTVRNKEFGTEKDIFCTYNELQEMLKDNKGLVHVLSAPAIVGDHVVKQGDGKMDGGMKEVFSKIGDKHPGSHLQIDLVVVEQMHRKKLLKLERNMV